ncbi:MAG: hypothetical protein JWP15_953, partial [Alphaproteobacteria bacterium]|nr:hypothetical protein [Alphaproteobacteria bacterium]
MGGEAQGDLWTQTDSPGAADL